MIYMRCTMKRIVTLLIAVIILTAELTACSGGNTPADTAENSLQTETGEKNGPAETEETPSSDVAGTVESSSVSSGVTESDPEDTPAPQETETDPDPDPDSDHKTVLVVVFSATGTTKGVAQKIAAIENADFYEIKAKQEYTSADLNWHDSNSRSTKEQNDESVRPEIGSDPVSPEGYEKIYIGYPIWWGEEPRIMDTFVESYDFGGITMIPFCTSSSSGIGRSGRNLADNAKSGVWLDGKRFSGSVSESELSSWIDSLK